MPRRACAAGMVSRKLIRRPWLLTGASKVWRCWAACNSTSAVPEARAVIGACTSSTLRERSMSERRISSLGAWISPLTGWPSCGAWPAAPGLPSGCSRSAAWARRAPNWATIPSPGQMVFPASRWPAMRWKVACSPEAKRLDEPPSDLTVTSPVVGTPWAGSFQASSAAMAETCSGGGVAEV